MTIDIYSYNPPLHKVMTDVMSQAIVVLLSLAVDTLCIPKHILPLNQSYNLNRETYAVIVNRIINIRGFGSFRTLVSMVNMPFLQYNIDHG